MSDLKHTENKEKMKTGEVNEKENDACYTVKKFELTFWKVLGILKNLTVFLHVIF